MSDKNLKDAGIVHDFLQKKYLNWLESLSLLRSMSEGVMAVQKLEALVKTKEARQLTELLRDARRFILSHKRTIEIAPLQVYASALVFSPTRSLIRELFQNEEPNWITLKPRVESDWNACLQTLEGHCDSVNSVAFSADGQRLASGSIDKTVKIWDAATGAYIQTLEGHAASVNSVAFSPDGQYLASGSIDKIIKVWDAATGICLQTLGGHSDWVNSVAFSADGQRLASGSDDKTIKVWDAATGACLQTLKGHSDWVNSVAFSADGQRLASGSADETIKVWDAATGACLETLEGHRNSVRSMAFSADVRRLASGSDDKIIKVWDAATGACLQTLKGHSSSVNSVAFSADGQRLASGSDDKTIKVWDTTIGTCVQTLEIDRVITHLSFDTMTNSLLSTDIGLLNLDLSALLPAINSRSTDATLRNVRQSGWGISIDGIWIVKDGKGVLWLPREYRVEEFAVVGSAVAIGCRSGRVLVMKFS
ncbi:G-protein beta WD-40 repeat [Fusarium oxysporum f. sp. vasinfectum]|nr:G-protein beta WD-40 repeat [Fusarium oxysporum f. sp. vasinfectum]